MTRSKAWASGFVSEGSGQAMVEFALVLPIILLLLFGMLQFALVLNARQTVAYAAEAAANSYAQTLVRATADRDAFATAAQLRPQLSSSGHVSYTLIHGAKESAITTDGVGTFGDLVAAHVTYDFPSPVRGGIGSFRFPGMAALTAEAVARIERPGAAVGSVITSPPIRVEVCVTALRTTSEPPWWNSLWIVGLPSSYSGASPSAVADGAGFVTVGPFGNGNGGQFGRPGLFTSIGPKYLLSPREGVGYVGATPVAIPRYFQDGPHAVRVSVPGHSATASLDYVLPAVAPAETFLTKCRTTELP